MAPCKYLLEKLHQRIQPFQAAVSIPSVPTAPHIIFTALSTVSTVIIRSSRVYMRTIVLVDNVSVGADNLYIGPSDVFCGVFWVLKDAVGGGGV